MKWIHCGRYVNIAAAPITQRLSQSPALFPQSIILCGIRDVKDYRMHSDIEKAIITGGSAFNIKAKSLRLGNFTTQEIEELYHQHTAETGQPFANDVFPLVWELTAGQPWLVNAVAYEACFEMQEGKDRGKEITVPMIQQAKENLILRRETHLAPLSGRRCLLTTIFRNFIQGVK